MFENGIRPAGDPNPASEAVQRVAREAAKKADRQTRDIKRAIGGNAGRSNRPASTRRSR